MSCDRNGGKVSKVCAVQNGVSAVGSKAAGIAGGTMASLDRLNDRLGHTAAPVARVVLGEAGAFNSRQKRGLQAAGKVTLAGAGYASRKSVGPAIRKMLQTGNADRQIRAALKFVPHGTAIYLGIKATDGVSQGMGTALANITATGDAGSASLEKRRWLLFKSKEKVDFWRSGMTGLLNRQDQMTRDLVSSQGAMFTVKGKTWHQGTSVVRTSAGEQTITHLRSMNLLGQHYYFDRALTAEQAAGVATGRVKPDAVPGFKGQVNAAESLVSSWATIKHSLIKTSLHWPQEE